MRFIATILAGLLAIVGAAPAAADPLSTNIFTGSGQNALIGQHLSYGAASAATPDIGAQVTLQATGGGGNKQGAYKIAFTASVVGDAQSADLYSINTITHGPAGPGGRLITGIEADVNNVGAHATTLGAPTAAYGNVAVAAGNFDSTAAYWATASTNGKWTYAFAASNTNASSIQEAGFYDGSSSTRVLQATGAHTTGIDFLGAALTFAIVLPNAAINAQMDSAGVLRNTLTLDSANRLQLGWTGGAIVWNGTLRPAGDVAENLGAAANRIGTGYFYNLEATNQITYQGKVVSLGAPDSCGAGYRCWRAPN